MLIGESNVAIDPAIGGYGVADIYLGEFSPHFDFHPLKTHELSQIPDVRPFNARGTKYNIY